MSPLHSIDGEELAFFLIELETSFNISLEDDNFTPIHTLGELCDLIKNKLPFQHKATCTSQQAFYKLRQAIGQLDLGKIKLEPSSKLHEIFPLKNRRQQIQLLEKILGFKLNLLSPPTWAKYSLLSLFFLSFISLFIQPILGVFAYIILFLMIKLTYKWGKEFELISIKDVVKKMVREQYHNCRRYPSTYNKDEIEPLFFEWLNHTILLPEEQATRDTIIH